MSEQMKATYTGNLACEIRQASSQTLIYTDANPNPIRQDAFSPTDLLASALAACTLSMMAFVAQREDIDLHDTTITYEKEMASKPVSRVGKITLHIVVQSSRPLDDALRAKLEAAARACPVRQSLHPDVDVVEHFEYLV